MLLQKLIKMSLLKVGKFYQAYEDDTYVIRDIMGYNVYQFYLLGKVQNSLHEYKVNN